MSALHGCKPDCPKRVCAMAHCRGGVGNIVVCVSCGSCLTPNSGLSELEIAAIIAVAQTLHSNKAMSRLTLRKDLRKVRDDGKAE
jgi:hypothetical protein